MAATVAIPSAFAMRLLLEHRPGKGGMTNVPLPWVAGIDTSVAGEFSRLSGTVCRFQAVQTFAMAETGEGRILSVNESSPDAQPHGIYHKTIAYETCLPVVTYAVTAYL